MDIMNDKIVLVTGATSGIGKETARELAYQGATILLHSRTIEDGRRTRLELQQCCPAAKFDLFVADLANQQQLKRMVFDITHCYNRLDILINNAATFCDSKQYNSKNIELTFAVNHLAPFLLSHLLLPLLQRANSGKIINIGSHAHYTGRFDLNNLQGQKQYNGVNQYCNSKLFTLLFTYELADRLSEGNVTVNAVHPGLIATDLYTKLFVEFDAEMPVDGTDTIVYLCASPEVTTINGEYFMGRLPVQSSYNSYKKRYQRQLWNYSEQLTGLEDGVYHIAARKNKFQLFRYLKKLASLFRVSSETEQYGQGDSSSTKVVVRAS